jgi:hypothetical protein
MNKKCLHKFSVYADPEQGNMLPTPKSCPYKLKVSIHHQEDPNGKYDRSVKSSCGTTNLREVENERYLL